MDLQLDQYLDVMRRVEGRARSLGSTFRLKREKLGKSLRDISEETCIPERLLQTIEAGDFRSIPGYRFFYEDCRGDDDIKSYIRTYAKFISVTPVECGDADIDPGLSSDFNSNGSTVFESERETVRLPRLGQYLLCLFLTERERVSLIGDLAEEYQEIFSAFGHRKAKCWFYEQVFGSLSPLTYRLFSRVEFLFGLTRLIRRLGR
jgi:transcriptional regulator with XRE-family HTH domain